MDGFGGVFLLREAYIKPLKHIAVLQNRGVEEGEHP